MKISEIQAYCITLDPTNKDRALNTLIEIKKLGFKNPTFISGVDLKKSSDDFIRKNVTPRAFMELNHGRYTHDALSGKGSVGCYMAHTNVWKLCIQKNAPLAIFEDDFVSFPGDDKKIQSILSKAEGFGFDVLRFHQKGDVMINEELNDDLVNITKSGGLVTYIMTPNAAKKLLSTAFPIDAHVDHYLDMGCYYHGLKNIGTKKSFYNDPHLDSVINHGDLKNYELNMNIYTLKSHWMCILFIILVLIGAFFVKY